MAAGAKVRSMVPTEIMSRAVADTDKGVESVLLAESAGVRTMSITQAGLVSRVKVVWSAWAA